MVLAGFEEVFLIGFSPQAYVIYTLGDVPEVSDDVIIAVCVCVTRCQASLWSSPVSVDAPWGNEAGHFPGALI